MDLEIAGKVALVCGASKGLGFACAQALAREKARPVLVGRDSARLRQAADKLRDECSFAIPIIVADLTRHEGVQTALMACPEPDILVTNCGGPPSRNYTDLTTEDWMHSLAGHFLAPMEFMRSIVPVMSRKGFGRVVNITSMSVRAPVRHLELSTASRLALTGYVAGVARQVANTGVTINNLLPGPIATERLQELGATADQLVSKIPMGRAGLPEEFGATCAYLCSMQAGFITGQNLLIDGGLCSLTV